MAILHKNITAAADIHNPKWFSDANNGDYAFKNEKGELESTDELLLPSALNFVDGSVAPPTTNSGDIYILSSGGSVNAGWGSVALQDWVRYDGSAWNSITPQKSSLCYDKTADSLMVYDGAAWAALGGGGGGGNTIYTANDTIGSGRELTLTNTVRFKNGEFIIEGSDTLSTTTVLEVFDGDTIPNSLWDFTNDGGLIGSKAKVSLIAQNATNNDLAEYITRFRNSGDSATYGIITNRGYFHFGIGNTVANTDFTTCFQLGHANSINTTSAYFGLMGYGNALTGSGNYRYVVGKGNTTSAGSEQVILGVDNTVSANYASMIGSEGVLSGLYGVAVGRAHSITHQFSVGLGAWVKSGASGASIIGHGVEADKTQKLENSTANSLALGWNSTTPQHLFKSDGVNLTLPTSSSGLSSGDLWNDGGTVKIV